MKDAIGQPKAILMPLMCFKRPNVPRIRILFDLFDLLFLNILGSNPGSSGPILDLKYSQVSQSVGVVGRSAHPTVTSSIDDLSSVSWNSSCGGLRYQVRS